MNDFQTQKSDIISRLKGLGEIDKSYMAGFMFNEKTRVLEQVEMGNKDRTLEILEQILGDDPMDRKEILFG
jgi:DNA gyrase/topoisomerase IV subunit B